MALVGELNNTSVVSTTEFLQCLFGKTEGLIEIRAYGKDTTKQNFYPVSEIPELVKKVNSQLHKNNAFGVTTRKRKKGGKEDVQHVVALWSDVDAKDFREFCW
ncbi:MAG: hypothetical protein WA125_06510 [Desulfosporosinus sp.]